MKIHNLLSVFILATVVALGYVHQQVEIVKIGYQIYESNESLDQLLVVNGILSYNVTSHKLPNQVYSRLLEADEEFGIVYSPEVVHIYPEAPRVPLARYQSRRRTDILAYLGITPEAEALTIADKQVN